MTVDTSRLCCYGCSHEAVGVPWPGQPSGERPCSFCVRNPIQHLSDDESHHWYDGSDPISVPMDCYSPLDMVVQVEVWLAEAKKEDTESLRRLLETERKLREAMADGGSGSTE